MTKEAMTFVQRWRKKDLIFPYTPQLQDSVSHCQQPTPYFLTRNLVRVYFSSRNKLNYSQVYYFDIDLETLEVLYHSSSPVLTVGQGFDEHGVYASSVVQKDDLSHMYFIGYKKLDQKFTTSIGLAFSNPDTATFEKHIINPIIVPGIYDPCLVSSPFVMIENQIWRMWYISGFKWEESEEGHLQSFYHIKYAESSDGIQWIRKGFVSIDFNHSEETNIARPWIIKEDNIYKAWFSYACGRQGYRIGYAESTDGGYTFTRMDEKAGITISDKPWENEAIAYPAVIVYQGRKYMFYNGNQLGKDGIALAISES